MPFRGSGPPGSVLPTAQVQTQFSKQQYPTPTIPLLVSKYFSHLELEHDQQQLKLHPHRLPSGSVLEVGANPSPQQQSVAPSAPDANQEEFQTFVFTEVLGEHCFTIGNTATPSVLELTGSRTSGPLSVIASTPRPSDRSQQWECVAYEGVDLLDYYVIQNIGYPGIVVDLDQTGTVVVSAQPRRRANLKEENADLKEEIEEKDSVIKDKDEEIKRLREGAVVDGYDAVGWKDKYLSSESTRIVLAEHLAVSGRMTTCLEEYTGLHIVPLATYNYGSTPYDIQKNGQTIFNGTWTLQSNSTV